MFPRGSWTKYKKAILVTYSFNRWRVKSRLLLPLIAATVWLYWPYWVICHSVLKMLLHYSNIKSSVTANTRGIFWPQPNCLPPHFLPACIIFLLCHFLIDLFSICLSCSTLESRCFIPTCHLRHTRWEETAANTLDHKHACIHKVAVCPRFAGVFTQRKGS